MYRVLSDVKMPYIRRVRNRKYPFAKMQIGDMFFVPFEENEDRIKAGRQVTSACAYYFRKTKGNIKFSVQRCTQEIVNENKVKEIWGTGVWRVK